MNRREQREQREIQRRLRFRARGHEVSEIADRSWEIGKVANWSVCGRCRPEGGNKFPHSICGCAAVRRQGPKHSIHLLALRACRGGRASAQKLEAQASGAVRRLRRQNVGEMRGGCDVAMGPGDHTVLSAFGENAPGTWGWGSHRDVCTGRTQASSLPTFRVIRVFRGSCLGRHCWGSRLKAELRTPGCTRRPGVHGWYPFGMETSTSEGGADARGQVCA